MESLNQAVEELKALIPATGDWGIVLYTDGGYREKSNASSWGLHGYFYDYVDRKGGYGLKKCGPTNTGYVGPAIRVVDENNKVLRRSLKNRLDVKPVRIAAYIDGYEPLVGGTNNYAEVLGLLNALKFIEALSPPQTQLVLDSEYAMKGALLWNSKWKQQNYLKPDGSVRDNKELWIEIDEVLTRIEEKKIKIAWDWVKGHMDDIGNNSADQWSNQAMNAVVNGHLDLTFQISPVAKYWSPTVDIHPLLREPRLYMVLNKPQEYLTEGKTYFFGNVGPNDGVEGQPSADQGYSVINLPDADPVLSTVKDYFVERCLKNKDIFIARLRNDMITKAKVYKEILEHGSKFFEPYLEEQVIKNVHTRSHAKGFGEAIHPAELSFKLANNLLGLEALLAEYLKEGQSQILSHDITELFYQEEEKKKKTVNKFISSNKASIRGDIHFEHENEMKQRAVALTFGIDLPSQTTLRAVTNFNPKVELIHWQEKPFERRYATILKTDLGIGLWCGIYSNKAFLVNLR